MQNTLSFGNYESQDNYLFGVNHPLSKAELEKRLESYFSELKVDFADHIKEDEGLWIVQEMLLEAQRKVEIRLDNDNVSDYLGQYITYKKACNPTEEDCFSVAEDGIEKVNEHQYDEQDNRKLEILQIPKNKSELFEMDIEDVTERIKRNQKFKINNNYKCSKTERHQKSVNLGLKDSILSAIKSPQREEVNRNNLNPYSNYESIWGEGDLEIDNYARTQAEKSFNLTSRKNETRTGLRSVLGASNIRLDDSVDPKGFVDEVQKNKREFAAKMKILKINEQNRRKIKEEKDSKQKEEKLFVHNANVHNRCERLKEILRDRQISREQDKIQHQQFAREDSAKVKYFQTIGHRYEYLLTQRKKEKDNMLNSIHEKFRPHNPNDFIDHSRKVNAQLNINDIKRVEKAKKHHADLKEKNQKLNFILDTPRPHINTHGRTEMELQKVKQDQYKRDIALEYARKIKKDLFPKLHFKRNPVPLPIDQIEERATHRLQVLTGYEHTQRSHQIGNAYMHDAKLNVKKHEPISSLSPDQKRHQRKRALIPLAKRPEYPNYLQSIRDSNILKRNSEGWKNIIENQKLNSSDKYECMMFELEKQDLRNTWDEKLQKCGALKDNKTSQRSCIQSIHAKLALLDNL